MKKSCALIGVVWLALVGAYAYVAWTRIQETIPALIVGVLGGTFAAMLVGSVMGLLQGGKDRAALRRAKRGAPRQDGRLEAASGPIRPLGAALESPFTGRACVAYEYDVKSRSGERSDFAGVALTPCAIDSGTGRARLLGWSVLDAFATPRSEMDENHASAYLRRTTFEPLGLTSVLSTLGSLMADDDGSIKRDFQIEGAPVDLADRKIIEKVVPVGETVTALGIWSAEKGGFIARGAAMNRLYPYGIPGTIAEVVGTSRKSFGIAVVFFVVLHAILVPMYKLSPGPPKKDHAGKEMPENPSVWDERDCERLKDLLAAGADPNEQANAGRTPLMNAVSNGNVECVKALLAAGAHPDTADEDGSSAMSWAITGEREDLVQLMKQSGGIDFRVTAENGKPLTADDEPMRTVKAYDAAIHSGDLDALERVSRKSTTDLIRKHDVLKVWQNSRPAEPEFVSGFWNDSAATLTVKGQTASPLGPGIVYHLKKEADGWHVDKEWFLEKGATP